MCKFQIYMVPIIILKKCTLHFSAFVISFHIVGSKILFWFEYDFDGLDRVRDATKNII